MNIAFHRVPGGSTNSLPVIPAQWVWEEFGISRGTGYRLIQDGLLEKTYLNGKLFVTRASLDRLVSSMLRGELSSPLLRRRGRRPNAAATPSVATATIIS